MNEKSHKDWSQTGELHYAMQEMLAEDNLKVKSLAAAGKKLAREVVRRQAMVKVIQNATRNVGIDGHQFGHAEAFMLMAYKEVGGGGQLLVWNSRDGEAPFYISLGSKKYQHDVLRQRGPFFDLPREHAVTHVWVTRTDAQVLEAWHRIVDKAVKRGRIDPDKAASMRDDPEVVKSWYYRIGLRDLETGRFTDEEAPEASAIAQQPEGEPQSMTKQRIPATVLRTVPYDHMVDNLFKHMGSREASLLHAAVGISSETAELLVADSIENIVEELGDLEFYIAAGYRVLGGRHSALAHGLVLEASDPAQHQVLGTVTIAMSTTAGRLLDLAKKGWVYGKPLDDNAERAIRYELMRLERMMEQLLDMVGVRRPDVLRANQTKLGKRYPRGVYTDQAAQVRADKADGE